MILFNGIAKKGKVNYVSFKNDKGQSVDVPIDELSANRIASYLAKISPEQPVYFERNNDEMSD